jgi:hypothetical protein
MNKTYLYQNDRCVGKIYDMNITTKTNSFYNSFISDEIKINIKNIVLKQRISMDDILDKKFKIKSFKDKNLLFKINGCRFQTIENWYDYDLIERAELIAESIVYYNKSDIKCRRK